jgi:hypothetical protein
LTTRPTTGISAPATTDPPIRMPLRQELLDEMARSREAAELEAERARRRELIRAALLCIGWMLLGLYFLGWSMHTTDEHYGRIAFYGGLIVGNSGSVYTLLNTYHRLEKRGDL